jgi:hypothetical protein
VGPQDSRLQSKTRDHQHVDIEYGFIFKPLDGPPMKSTRYILALCTALILCYAWYAGVTAHAQSTGEWSAPVLLSGDREAYFPAIAADDSGQVHALWIERGNKEFPGWGDGLTYARLRDGVWSEPLDVLSNPMGYDNSVSPPAIAVAGGGLHAVWSSTAGLFYSSTPIGAPLSSRSWSKPIRIGEGGGAPFIVADSRGVLHVTTLDAVSVDPGIDYVRSTDNGLSWSSPVRLSSPVRKAGPIGAQAFSTYMLIGKDDRVHVTWADPFDGGSYYVSSANGGDTWSSPVAIGAEQPGETNRGVEPSIGQDGDGNLVVMWQGVYVPDEYETCARYQRVSTDQGATWSPRERKFFDLFQGCLGWNMMRLDSSGKLHVLMIGRQWDNEHRLFHSTWKNMQWSAPEWVAGVATPTTINWDAVGIDQPQFVITEGNRLHGVWVTRDRRVWYTSKTADAPRVPPQPIPAADAIAAVPAAIVAPAVAEKPAENAPQEAAAPAAGAQLAPGAKADAAQTSKAWTPIVAGVLPAVLLILAVMLIALRRRSLS